MTTVFCWCDFEYCPCGSGVFECVCNLVGLIFFVQLSPFLVVFFGAIEIASVLIVSRVNWRTDILSCMQFVLHAAQLGVFFLNSFALAEQWQNSERLNFIFFRGEAEFPTYRR